MDFKIVNQLIVHNSDEVNVADTLNCLQATFDFDSSWDGRVKTAHFSNGDNSYSFQLIADEITPDKGLNLTEGVWGISVSGIKTVDDLINRKTTNIFLFRVLASGFADGSPFPVISPDVLEVIQADIQTLQNMLSVPSVPDSIVVRDATASINVNTLRLDTTPTGVPIPGEIYWDPESLTASIMTNFGVSLQVNQEQTYPVMNITGVQINDGTVCSWDSAIGASGNFRVKPFIANGTITSERVLGIATHNIANGTLGLLTSVGMLKGLNTSGSEVDEVWADGEVLYAHPTLAGKMTKVKPSAPNQIVRIGAVLRAHATTGIMFVRPTIYPANATLTADGMMSAVDKQRLDTLWAERG